MKKEDYEAEMALLHELENGSIQAFLRFYKNYSEDLLIVAFCILNDSARSIYIVDLIFENLWREARFVHITIPIHKFLYNQLVKDFEKQYPPIVLGEIIWQKKEGW